MDIFSKQIRPQTSGVTRTNLTRTKEKSASKFSTNDALSDTSINQSQDTFAVTALNSVFLDMQENKRGARQAIAYGENLLDELEKLQFMLINESLSIEQLQRLQEMLKLRPVEDLPPELAETIAEIEIRAAVEIAKLANISV